MLRQITPRELSAQLQKDNSDWPIMLDIREAWEWAIVHIPGSRHMPIGQIPSRLDEIDHSRPTVVICHHGVRSLQVVAFLQRAGFSNLHNLQGGIDAWAREVEPGMPLY